MMALLPFPDSGTLPDTIKKRLQEFEQQHGRASLLTLMSGWFPPIVEALEHMARMTDEGLLEPWFKELLFVAASDARGCSYCAGGHSRILVSEFGLDQDVVRQMRSGTAIAELDTAKSALVQFMRKVATDWNRITEQDIAALRQQGWSEPEMMEAIAMTMKAAFTNTLTAALRLEEDVEVDGYF